MLAPRNGIASGFLGCGTDLSKIPSNPPTVGWARLEAQSATSVKVPGTVEQYLYRRTKNEDKHTQGLVGVSWWYRTVDIPAGLEGKTVLLDFESTRYRAEVYINRKLVAYNLVEGTPFTASRASNWSPVVGNHSP